MAVSFLLIRVVFIFILPRNGWQDAFNYSRSFSENAIATGQADWSIHTDSQEGMEKSFKKFNPP